MKRTLPVPDQMMLRLCEGVPGRTRWAKEVRRYAALAAILGVWAGCDSVDAIRNELRDHTPHEAYRASLQAAGLNGTALTTQWIEASSRALTNPTSIALPYREEGFLFTDDPGAPSFRFHMRRGQTVTMDLSLDSPDPARVFLDLFRMPEDSLRAPLPLLSADSILGDFEYTAGREADYLIRLQPELLRGGRFTITLRLDASLTFPVEGRSTGAIQSVFGDPRDGGSRRHHGVDIFAPRGTPVISATDGRVTRANTTNIGGKVVWVRDTRGQSLYYAHLDSQVVRSGARVLAGDVLGFVGNTGNARTTPPHLHFGVYSRGPVNPWYYLYQPTTALPDPTAPREMVGDWTRTRNEGMRLREGPGSRATVIGELAQATPLKVLAAVGAWYRVELPDGRVGFVSARLTEAPSEPLRTEMVTAVAPIQTEPRSSAPVMQDVAPGTDVPVLGAFGDYLWVRSPNGRAGWMVQPGTVP